MCKNETVEQTADRFFRLGFRMGQYLYDNGYVVDWDNRELLLQQVADGELTLVDPEKEIARATKTNYAVALKSVARDQEDARRLLDYQLGNSKCPQ